MVTEPGCMNVKTGSYQHIQVGIRELSNSFEVLPALPSVSRVDSGRAKRVSFKGADISGCLKGTLSDARMFLRKAIHGVKLANFVRQKGVAGVYLRAVYIDLFPLILKIYGIPFLSRQMEFSIALAADFISPGWSGLRIS